MTSFPLTRRQLVMLSGSAALLALPGRSLFAQNTSNTFLQPSDFAGKSMATLLGYGDAQNVGKIRMFDPYWLDKDFNRVGQNIDSVDPNDSTKGLSNGVYAANIALTAGVPTVNIQDYAGGIESPNTDYYRAKTSGPIGRATGVMIDGNGKVGGFVNGYDTPNDKPDGKNWDDPGWKEYGPDIHFAKDGYSG
ncbi:hypothetical protein M0D46_08175 [Xanthomonas prunicola]|uniref:hypothetical protein n=1 Tax=Xanthomonas prunicola TaxID=2053930 RepID=UPI0021B4ACA6|nr:hypothetical protein [Xanthomonas prunicola]UXA70979.1 hypothetical protein M0D46_08175 [Xanthomonas prunicola]